MARDSEALLDKDKEKWLERFARSGIIAKGIVYCLIGVLASLPILGLQGRKMSKSDAFKLIYDQPFGKILLIIIGVSLIGYVSWRLFQAVKDIDGKGDDLKAKASRAGYAISAIIYAGLSFYALKLAFSGAGSGGDDKRQFFIGKILELPAGEWIVGITGVIIFANGIRQIYRGISGKFCRNVRLIGNQYQGIFKKTGVAGYVSRGMVLLVIGYFFFRAALHGSGSEIQGTKGAFDFIENSFGSVLMALVAVGLIGYGIFMFVKARYQEIDLDF